MNLDRRLLRLARSVRALLLFAVGLGALGGILLVIQAWLLSRTINAVFLGGATLADVTPLLAALGVVALVRAGAVWGSEIAAGRAAGWVKDDLRARLFEHLLALGPLHARGERSGELANTLTTGVEALDAYFAQYLPGLALAALVPLTVLLAVLPLDLLSGLVLLLTAPLIPFFMILIGRLADAVTRRQWAVLSRMSAHFLDALQGLTTLKLFGRSRAQVNVIARIGDQFRQTTLGVLRVAFLSALALELLATLSTAVVAVQIGVRLLYGYLDFEQALFFLVLAPEFYLPLRALGVRFHAGVAGVTAAARIFEILESNRQDAEDAKTEDESANLAFLASWRFDGIRFENISYTYAEADGPALDGVSFALKAGQITALVGPSGAGKSTIAALLLRFAEPQRGQITAGGVPLAAIPAADWRTHVAWVPQQPHLFYGTVLDNLRLARPDATMDEVIWAAQQAHIHDVIAALPQGYDTLIGERGTRLSGGQAQRIALARAFLKDAPLFILDEATSGLDPEHEAWLAESVERLARGRTTLIIAHRLSTVRRADLILVLDGGRVVEQGSYTRLSQDDGLFRRLVVAYEG